MRACIIVQIGQRRFCFDIIFGWCMEQDGEWYALRDVPGSRWLVQELDSHPLAQIAKSAVS